MSHTTSSTVLKICQEASLFNTKDRLLQFSTKSEFQTPLQLESGDTFYERWTQSGNAIPLETFVPVTASFGAQQKDDCIRNFTRILKEKKEDFGTTDLFLLLGFLKWDGNALAPSLLIPLDTNDDFTKLTLTTRPPLENIVLKERLAGISLPKAEDATVDGQFNIQLYFSLFEKAICGERNWKFTRHGICLAFLNSSRLRLKKNMEEFYSERKIDSNNFLTSLLDEDGFKLKESVFDDADFDQSYTPADHHFLYTTDSHSTKVALDALDENNSGFAIQALPGTQKMKVVANIVADSVVNGKKTLVVTRRAATTQSFQHIWKPMFRSFNGPEREQVVEDVNRTRSFFSKYYKAVNSSVQSAKTSLPNVLQEFAQSTKPRSKFVDAIFQEAGNLNYNDYKTLRKVLEQIVEVYFDKNGIIARKTFLNVNVKEISSEKKTEIAGILKDIISKVEFITPIVKLFESEGFFPTGIFLPALLDMLTLLRGNYDENTPVFENWDLRSNSWNAYQDSLKALPEAGDKWVRYHRQTSDIYTDDAVDENILGIRDEFAESLKATLKGLNDHYRNSRRMLLKLLKNPKDATSDAKLLDLIDTLLELQENKRAYKDTAVLGNHLLGKDWLYETSNWISLNNKITFLYNFREKHGNKPELELMLTILEHWHQIKPQLPQFEAFTKATQDLLLLVRELSKELALEVPLESQSLDKWIDEIRQWDEHWETIDSHIELNTLFNIVDEFGCASLQHYVQNPNAINNELVAAFTHYWSGVQVQRLNMDSPELFACAPKAHHKLSQQYRTLLDNLCNANFRKAHACAESGKLSVLSMNEAFTLDKSTQFDIAILLDADSISVAEAVPLAMMSKRTILVGNPHVPPIDISSSDAFLDIAPVHTSFFLENIMTAALRRGIPTRELWYSDTYTDTSLIQFANERIYGNGIKQIPVPNRDIRKGETLRIVADKVTEIAQAAISYAEHHPGQSLGVVAFSQARCSEISTAIDSLVKPESTIARFFSQTNTAINFYVKTPDRAVEKYRDTIFICADPEGFDKISGEHKLAVCTTLARQEVQVFVSKADMEKQATAKPGIFWDWIQYLQTKSPAKEDARQANSILRPQVMGILQSEGIKAEQSYAAGGIPVGPVVIDSNNSKRFLAVIEDDCTTERFRESVEDREYVRPVILRQLGWKVIQLWTPFWYIANRDEISHVITTIAIEQSVAPPPPEETKDDSAEKGSAPAAPEVVTVPYAVVHPKIEGTAHDKPIAELPAASLIVQMKFYVDHESPIHEELLLSRLLELHHVDRAGPMILQALNDAIKQGFQKHKFIKTGKFFYTTNEKATVKLRDRSARPENERKMVYVSPEERALLPVSMDEFKIKQALGLL